MQATGEVATVYNFRVAAWHTYFVGDVDWEFALWAHNADYDSVANGAHLTISRPRILNTRHLDDRELSLANKAFRTKIRGLQSAARRGELRFTPNTDGFRISELQAAYRARVAARYRRIYGKDLDLSRLDADHSVDLVVGGSASQRLKMRHRSINRSIGASLKNAADKSGLKPGDVIASITVI